MCECHFVPQRYKDCELNYPAGVNRVKGKVYLQQTNSNIKAYVINLFYVFVNQTGSVSLAHCVRFCRAVLAFAGRCGWELCNYNVWLSEQDVLAFNA